jgi:hypothetical protein
MLLAYYNFSNHTKPCGNIIVRMCVNIYHSTATQHALFYLRNKFNGGGNYCNYAGLISRTAEAEETQWSNYCP